MAGTTNPLEAIDWGTQVDRSDIRVYFGPAGFVQGNLVVGWSDYEKQQAMLALEQFSNVIDIGFREISSARRADFFLTIQDLDDAYGQMYAPGQRYAGLAAFDDDVKSGLVPLEQGSFAFCVLLHEFGHGLGIAHPHDEGGTSKVLKGVTAEIGSYGIGGLNQGVYTTMTYNDGWPTGPLGASAGEGYGYQATPMALDIAVLQEKYGANLAHATGDDVYRLPQANREGTYYACIWDGGGADRIVFRGNADCAIDLREASLRGETGGAGWLSYADGIHGGLTIANGVVIERARGGGGDDVIRGNGAGNLLRGHAGSDLLMGANGPDRLYGGAGPDELRGGRSDDLLVGGPGPDIFVVGAGSGNDRIMDFHPDADQIRIRSGATGFDPIAVSQDDDAAMVAFADVTLRLDDVPASALDAGDFLFV